MAKITKLSASLNRTVNLYNFENVKLEAAIEVELEDGDNFAEEYAKAFSTISKEINARAKKIEEWAAARNNQS